MHTSHILRNLLTLRARYSIMSAIRTDEAMMKCYRLTEQLTDIRLMVVASLYNEKGLLRILHEQYIHKQKCELNVHFPHPA